MQSKKELKFMDFCAGIGGGRLGLEKIGAKCVGYSEIDHKAIKTYQTLYGDEEKNYGDLMKIVSRDLPDFDILIAGFPCQTFSVIGKRNGMNDKRGQVIYGLSRILKERKIKFFILENVKGLVNHDRGESLKEIIKELNDAGYEVKWQVLNSADFGVPHMRERIYFVGVRKDLCNFFFNYEFPYKIKKSSLKDFLIEQDKNELRGNDRTYETFIRYLSNKYNKGKYNIDRLKEEDYLVLDTRQSDLRLYRGKVPTLRTGRHGILYVKDKKFWKLTGYESFLLQGISEDKAQKVKNIVLEKDLLSQAGNAMTVNVISAIGNNLFEYINYNKL